MSLFGHKLTSMFKMKETSACSSQLWNFTQNEDYNYEDLATCRWGNRFLNISRFEQVFQLLIVTECVNIPWPNILICVIWPHQSSGDSRGEGAKPPRILLGPLVCPPHTFCVCVLCTMHWFPVVSCGPLLNIN